MYSPGLLEPLPNTLHSPVQAPVAVAQYRGSKVLRENYASLGGIYNLRLPPLGGPQGPGLPGPVPHGYNWTGAF